MSKFIFSFLFVFIIGSVCAQTGNTNQEINFYRADNPYFQYTGRIDFSDPAQPKFWSSGVYIKAKFKGDYCEVLLNDEVLNNSYHNYIEIVIDEDKAVRLQTTGKQIQLLYRRNFQIVFIPSRFIKIQKMELVISSLSG